MQIHPTYSNDNITDKINRLLKQKLDESTAPLLSALYVILANAPEPTHEHLAHSQMHFDKVDGLSNPVVKYVDWLITSINDEIRTSDKYHKKWIETQNPMFDELARDELRHSEKLIRIAKEQDLSGCDTEKLNELIVFHDVMVAKLI
ncbi:MAG: hypothetical protein LBC86_09685 [Oscillospiraceae bacterium]|jgi:hypothetical protein|nr:hypothetical protein [Oscillospiraceae bacterium]